MIPRAPMMWRISIFSFYCIYYIYICIQVCVCLCLFVFVRVCVRVCVSYAAAEGVDAADLVGVGGLVHAGELGDGVAGRAVEHRHRVPRVGAEERPPRRQHLPTPPRPAPPNPSHPAPPPPPPPPPRGRQPRRAWDNKRRPARRRWRRRVLAASARAAARSFRGPQRWLLTEEEVAERDAAYFYLVQQHSTAADSATPFGPISASAASGAECIC